MASPYIEQEVINYLVLHRNLDVVGAQIVYNDSINLYHQLFTIIDFNIFHTIDDQILCSIIIIIRENFELTDSFK